MHRAYRTSLPQAVCHMTAGQLAALAEPQLGDAQVGPLAEAKLRSVRGLVDDQHVMIPLEEAQQLGATVGIDILSTSNGLEQKHHIVRGLMERPQTIKASELKLLVLQSTAKVAEELSVYLLSVSGDPDLTIETELYELLQASVLKRARREPRKK